MIFEIIFRAVQCSLKHHLNNSHYICGDNLIQFTINSKIKGTPKGVYLLHFEANLWLRYVNMGK